ncbi:MAG: hypothetical protein KKH94_12965 [Candidatus Omnitrophica bacterium]|nr:hypothetical protein [Candidatus Omnitrophota bacterium]
MVKKTFFWINLVVLSFCLLFIIGEIIVRVTRLDMSLLRPLLWYQGAHVELYRVSANIDLHYELKPELQVTYPDEGGRTFTINEFGFRDKKRKKEKAKGVIRIVCLGGSNTIGACVNDDETYPAYLEMMLNETYGKKFEVWNAGHDAYVLSQKVALAKIVIDQYDPDLLIFQHINQRERAFLDGEEYAPFFQKDPKLYWENLEFTPFFKSDLGQQIFFHFSLYRATVIFLNYLISTPYNDHYSYKEVYVNESKFIEFYKQFSAKMPIVLMPVFANQTSEALRKVETIFLFRNKVNSRKMSEEYYLVHPPAYVYKWYAEVIMAELEKMGHIKKLIKRANDISEWS